MWDRHISRKHGKPFIVHRESGERKWCHVPPIAVAYDSVVLRDVAVDVRRHHNLFKRQLISEYVQSGSCVVDLACGRGGDLSKFARAGATRYHGVDIAGSSVAEAERRSSSFNSMACTFQIADMSEERIHHAPGAVDVASCQFALHFIANNSSRMRGLFTEVSRLLLSLIHI